MTKCRAHRADMTDTTKETMIKKNEPKNVSTKPEKEIQQRKIQSHSLAFETTETTSSTLLPAALNMVLFAGLMFSRQLEEGGLQLSAPSLVG